MTTMPRTNYTAPVVVSDIYVFFSRAPGSVVVERTYGRLAARRAHTLQAQVPRVLCTEPSSQLHALVDSPPERPQDKDQTTLAHPARTPARACLIDAWNRIGIFCVRPRPHHCTALPAPDRKSFNAEHAAATGRRLRT